MLHVALYQPEIPQNTGNIIRLCANTGARLHLIEPLGFVWDDKRLKRAGLDYHELASIERHPTWKAFEQATAGRRVFAFSSKAERLYTEVQFADEDCLLFGPETRGLPAAIREQIGPERCLKLPMVTPARSLNLANAVAVALYEAWRQSGFIR